MWHVCVYVCMCWLAEKDHYRNLYHCCRGNSCAYNCSLTWHTIRLELQIVFVLMQSGRLISKSVVSVFAATFRSYLVVFMLSLFCCLIMEVFSLFHFWCIYLFVNFIIPQFSDYFVYGMFIFTQLFLAVLARLRLGLFVSACICKLFSRFHRSNTF